MKTTVNFMGRHEFIRMIKNQGEDIDDSFAIIMYIRWQCCYHYVYAMIVPLSSCINDDSSAINMYIR